MIFFTIDKENRREHVYQQIYKKIKAELLEGRLRVNEKLPSKRELAERLQVSVNSVSSAYEQLLAEGYIYTIERSGYYVEALDQFIEQSAESLLMDEDLKETEVDRSGWLSLSHMSSDLSGFPFKEWASCQRAALSTHRKELAEVPGPQGSYRVRETIAKLISRTRGVRCEPEQIVLGSGTQALLQQFVGLQPEGIRAGIENPGYTRVYRMLRQMKIETEAIGLDEKGIDAGEVKKAAPELLFITPSHQFPTGTIMPVSRRIELLNWAARKHGRYIIEDDYDSEFKYGTDNIPALQSLDRNQNVVYMGTFSKTLGPGFRISYMVLPPALLRRYREMYDHWIPGTDAFSLFTLHYFIETGMYERHLKRMNHRYEGKRSRLIEELRKVFGTRIRIRDIPAGLHFLADIQTDVPPSAIQKSAEKEKLELYTLERFRLSEGGREKAGLVSLIIGFAAIEEEDIQEAAVRLERIL
ncbi:GntR family transcriptional regulator [Alteribacter lacisalsi]|uniref:GntR family transcriptional regulator n=1 Tax=Alteribacter lacisalsi TaxID=2045244 RepID=A0A2W0H9I7_9BACI|nr:PLP-dependent aminotransferase family protein [Alteribacter lacisalsi]PYZ96740.1 GntR family transcriptional regulator [Alteribacter lacisalsi]